MAPQEKRGAGSDPDPEDTRSLPEHLLKRPEMTWHDQLVNLLHLGVVFEHTLMVQYLYAAYSMGGDQIPIKHRVKVKEWQESLLAVAREEMGHLLTVQNILTWLGASFNLSRDRFPWAIEWFNMEPFSLGSLACYINAEMPETMRSGGTSFPEREQIEDLARDHLGKGAKPVHPVAEVYHEILKLLAHPSRIPEASLHPETYLSQASWDEWGRGYRPQPRALDPQGGLLEAPEHVHRAAQFDSNVLVYQVATRTDALAAIYAVALQGEGIAGSDKLGEELQIRQTAGSDKAGEWSHFQRFIKIYREFRKINDGSWNPAVLGPTNPNTNDDPSAPNREGYISCERSRNWAVLLNVRYKMMYRYLSHRLKTPALAQPDEPNLRAMLVHRIFGEMYQLKALSGRLFKMPLRDRDANPKTPVDKRRTAGPPFELPWNLQIPASDYDCWCMHRDALAASRAAIDAILKMAPTLEEKTYLETLRNLDAQTATWIDKIMAGFNSPVRYTT